MIRLGHCNAVFVALALFATIAVSGGCARAGDAPMPTGADAADRTLLDGRLTYISHCARCHGAGGGGGAGSRLAGKMVEKYPNVADQIEVVTNGKGAMPSWGNKLTAEEIAAVVDYTRRVL